MNKKITGAIIFLILFIIFMIAGLYAGGYVFLKLSGLPTDILNLTTLFDYKSLYWQAPEIKRLLKIGFFIFFLISILPVILVIIALIASKSKRELHGSARLASPSEIAASGLLDKVKYNNKGEIIKNPFEKPDLLIGKYKGQFLRWSSNQFALLAAPTRSGKTVGFVIPNLLHYRDSMVVFDPKLENYKITAGFRHKYGQKVFLFSPDNDEFKTHRWNPLSYIRRDSVYRVGDTFSIAQMLYPTGGKEASEGTTKFFNEKAQTLFMGLVLYMIETENEPGSPPTSLGTLISLTAPKGGLAKWIEKEIEIRLSQNKPLSKACTDALISFSANKSDNTSSGILDSLTAPLNPFRDPLTIVATNGNDFDFRQIRKEKMTIYIGIKPNNIAKFSGLINLFFSQLINENTQELPEDNPELKYQIALMMDEFTALGFLGILEKSIAYIAGYNIRLAIIFQNKSQMNKVYTENGTQTFFSNSACQIIFTPKDIKDANEYSELIGYETVKGTSISRSSGRSASRSRSESDQKRAVMLPQELREMPQTDCLINLEGLRVFQCSKIVYWSDPVFKDRIRLPLPTIPCYKDEIISISTSHETKNITNNLVSTSDFKDPAIINTNEILEKMTHCLIPNINNCSKQYIEAVKKAIIEVYGDQGIEFFNKYAI